MSTKYQAGLRVSEYVLEKCIGRGSFAEVWQARHHVWSSEEVAIKLPTEPDYVRSLRKEGIVVHGLRHPNIIRVLGIDPYAEAPYMVMELVKGPALRELIAQNPKGFKLSTATTILRGILNGLKAAHEANVLHRDIKPGNVMLHLDGRPHDTVRVEDVKVGDFGLGSGGADMLGSIMQSASINRDDALVGTLAYMAPELRDGRGQADPRSDLFSVGVVLFELLTGERPAGAELPGTMRSDVPPAMDEIFRRLYSRHDRRYESAAAVLADIDKQLGPTDAGLGGYETGQRPVAQQTGQRPVPHGPGQPGPHVPPLPRDPSLPPLPPGVARARHSGGPASDRLSGGPASGRSSGGPASGRSCRSCGRGVQTNDQFCIHCGVQLAETVRRCEQCGGYPGASDQFCIFCGSALAVVA